MVIPLKIFIHEELFSFFFFDKPGNKLCTVEQMNYLCSPFCAFWGVRSEHDLFVKLMKEFVWPLMLREDTVQSLLFSIHYVSHILCFGDDMQT